MKMEEATAYTAKCFNGEPASCSFACPFHLDIRSFLEKAQKGRWSAAYRELRNAVIFPVIVSKLCDQPCRSRCQRTLIGDEALALRDIEAAVIKYTKSRKPEAYFIPPKTQSVAVVGAGVAGLSFALHMAQKKYLVTVFDKEDGWGGSLRKHPLFNEFDEDIALQFSAVEVNFKFSTDIKALEPLQDFDAIYIATGDAGDAYGLLDSWEPALLTTANPKVFMGGSLCGASLMEGIAQGPELSKTVEVFLQTGKAAVTHGGYDKNYCGRDLEHPDAIAAPLIKAASEDGYTEEETKAEASRCLKCDCAYCENSCEMLKSFRKKPHKMAVEVYTDSQAGSAISSRTITRETYSCNICGKCKSVCPESVDIGALLQMSRSTRMQAGVQPEAFHDYWLKEMDFNTTEGFFAAPPLGKQTCDYAFFPGCQLGAAAPAHVLKAYDYLKSKDDTGLILGCCGAPAYWAGDQNRLDENLDRLRAAWNKLGNPTFVTACAYCGNVLEKFLPEIKRVSLYELLANDTSLTPARPFAEAAVFDPCAARDDSAMQRGVRTLSQRAGVTLHELAEPNRCCGYGGHMRLANPELYEEITTHRAQASDKPYIVYCANCRDVFQHKGKQSVHILDMVFGLEPGSRAPSLQSKRENSLEVKKQLMKIIENKDFTPEKHEWDDLKLLISDELLDDMDRKLIITDDLKEAIWLAEKSGDKFVDETDGISQCSMIKAVLTYWVQYKETAPATYEIFSAYTHRMRFSREG